jgi:hypothetical protein
MTNEQINIAVAEACGIDLEKYRTYEGDINVSALKKYCKDLNAIQDAVMILPENKRILYGMYLSCACGHIDKNNVGLWHISTATARHRAEAFLKTLGKWEE